MHISAEWFNDNFNLSLHSSQDKDPFITIKGCRIVSGSKGPFVSFPSRKLDSGKYWNHVYANEPFQAQVLKIAEAARPASQKAPAKRNDDDSDLPF